MSLCFRCYLFFPHPLYGRQLFSLLDDAELGPMAADGFSLLMSDSTDVLNRSCHADVRIMYRQRFFSENSAKLVQGFNAAPQGTLNTSQYLIDALSSIINILSSQRIFSSEKLIFCI